MSLLVLFDIDGTLVDTAGAGRAAIGYALERVYGTTGPIDDLPFDGRTDPGIARDLLRSAGLDDRAIDDSLERLWAAYVDRLRVELKAREREVRVAPGIHELLAELGAAGATLGLLTGNIVEGAREKLRACGLAGRFAFGAFGSDAEDRDRLPEIALARAAEHAGSLFEPHRSWVVGDTPRDIRCARAGGLRALAVATGRYGLDELGRHGPDGAVPTLADTHRVLDLMGVGGRAAVAKARHS